MSIATLVKGSAIGGIDISFALIGFPFALLLLTLWSRFTVLSNIN